MGGERVNASPAGRWEPLEVVADPAGMGGAWRNRTTEAGPVGPVAASTRPPPTEVSAKRLSHFLYESVSFGRNNSG